MKCSIHPSLCSLAILALTGCEAAPVVVTSADGIVTLEIPAGAFDDDVDIEITPGRSELEGLVDGFVYDFEPSGLRFDEPATLRIDVSSLTPAVADGELEIGLITDLLDENETPVEGVLHFETALEDGELVAQIDHFSAYVVGFGSPRAVQVDRATWITTPAEAVRATWDYVPQSVVCVPRCDPTRINTDRLGLSFERAHDPNASLAAPPPSTLNYQFVGSVEAIAREFTVSGNPNSPNDTTIFLRAIDRYYYGNTLHGSAFQRWNPVRAFGTNPTVPTNPGTTGGTTGTTGTTTTTTTRTTAGSICQIGNQEFEVRLSGENLSCTSGSCPAFDVVMVEVDWLTADPAGFNAEIPLRIVRQAPAAAPNDPQLDATWFERYSTDTSFTVTINTGFAKGLVSVPAFTLDLDGTPGPWVYRVEYGVSFPVQPTDGQILLNSNPPQWLDPSACNANAPQITLTIN